MKREPLLGKCRNARIYVKSYMRGLKCIGTVEGYPFSFELYQLPGSFDYGYLDSTGLCQVHPRSWHEDRKLGEVPKHPINTRIKIFPADVNGISKVRVLKALPIKRVTLHTVLPKRRHAPSKKVILHRRKNEE